MVQLLFQRLGLPAGRLRVDRIVDEARYSADPVRLMELFGLSNLSATRYVLPACPIPGPGGACVDSIYRRRHDDLTWRLTSQVG
ncbi:hypothetical protein [Streptomyces shenzhenensis]|uniref:hypothetical protein n=1 Tax=Streptomyces shenzhenensis TaxID=943815 RepID=UPI001F1C2464|nr:hypothetical protein [Streptomyces shenzhenensis]